MSSAVPPSEKRVRTEVRNPEIWAILAIVVLSLVGASFSDGAQLFLMRSVGPDLFIPHTLVLDGDWLSPSSGPGPGLRLEQRIVDRQCDRIDRQAQRIDRLAERHAAAVDRLGSRIDERSRLIEERSEMLQRRIEQRAEEQQRRIRERMQRLSNRISYITF